MYLAKYKKSLTLQFTFPLAPLPLFSPLVPLSSSLVLLLTPVSLSITTSPTSPVPALCTSVTSDASDSSSTLNLPPPLPPSIVHSTLDYCNSICLNLDSTKVNNFTAVADTGFLIRGVKFKNSGQRRKYFVTL